MFCLLIEAARYAGLVEGRGFQQLSGKKTVPSSLIKGLNLLGQENARTQPPGGRDFTRYTARDFKSVSNRILIPGYGSAA